MSIHVGLMGFGRIGRNIFRILSGQDQINVVAISDVMEPEAVEYLLRFDTVHGRFPGAVTAKGKYLYVKGRQIRLVQAREPKEVPWYQLGVDVVIEATTKYRTRDFLLQHIAQGAKKVILSVPTEAKEVDSMIVVGVNDEALRPEHRIVAAGSITTNCVALMLKIFHEAFGVESAYMTTVHAYTNAQRLADVPHTDLRQSRAAAENIIPTETRVPEAVAQVLPEMAGRLGALAINVPVPDGSNVDLVFRSQREVTLESVNEVVRNAAESQYAGLVEYMEEPIVSSDVIGDSHSAIFDSLGTQILGDRMAKTISWYDNGWGYAHRIVDLIRKISQPKEAA